MYPSTLPPLCLITDPQRHHLPFEETIQRAVQGGVRWVQLRDKRASARALFEQARALKQRLPDDILLVINERIDVAMAVGADGVHLPETGLSAHEARALLGPEAIIGCSVHSAEDAIAVEQQPIQYIQLGTIYPTDCKPGHPGTGAHFVREVTLRVELPVMAVGGINQYNLEEVDQAGAHGVSMIGAIMQSEAPEQTSRELLSILDRAKVS